MDKTAFLLACQSVMNGGKRSAGVGTLGEKTLHAVLKTYFDPDATHHEISVGPYIADVFNKDGIIEIQSRDFYRLREKLDLFLRAAPVTVVYPVPVEKWLIWLDEDGEASSKRKSPKHWGACEILPEIYRLKDLLGREGLRFCAVLLELEEYRLKNGWGNGGKRGSTRIDRLPVNLLGEVWLSSPEDYLALIPESLPEEFTAKEFVRAAGLSPRKASAALGTLLAAGAVARTGKVRNAYLYRRAGR